MYEMRKEGFSEEVGDFVTYTIVVCDDDASIAAAERMKHQTVLHETVTFLLEVRGFNIITST